jgi:hypothetical protein
MPLVKNDNDTGDNATSRPSTSWGATTPTRKRDASTGKDVPDRFQSHGAVRQVGEAKRDRLGGDRSGRKVI